MEQAIITTSRPSLESRFRFISNIYVGILTKKRDTSFGDGLIGMCNIVKTFEITLTIDFQKHREWREETASDKATVPHNKVKKEKQVNNQVTPP